MHRVRRASRGSTPCRGFQRGGCDDDRGRGFSRTQRGAGRLGRARGWGVGGGGGGWDQTVRLFESDRVEVRQLLELRHQAHAIGSADREAARIVAVVGQPAATLEEKRLVGCTPRNAWMDLRRRYLHTRVEPDRPAGGALDRGQAHAHSGGATTHDQLRAAIHLLQRPPLIAGPAVLEVVAAGRAARPQLHLGKPALACHMHVHAFETEGRGGRRERGNARRRGQDVMGKSGEGTGLIHAGSRDVAGARTRDAMLHALAADAKAVGAWRRVSPERHKAAVGALAELLHERVRLALVEGERDAIFDVGGHQWWDLSLHGVGQPDTPRARLEVAREVAHVVEGRLLDEWRARAKRLVGIHHDVGIAQVLEVVGAAGGVDELRQHAGACTGRREWGKGSPLASRGVRHAWLAIRDCGYGNRCAPPMRVWMVALLTRQVREARARARVERRAGGVRDARARRRVREAGARWNTPGRSGNAAVGGRARWDWR